ncbi:MAG: hypothetical protein V5A44_04265 [Haloarculaceae archaeon]
MVDRRLWFVRLWIGWTVGSVPVLVALDAFSLVLFYVVSLIGFVVMFEATASDTVDPRWRRRLRYAGAALVVGFGAFAVYEVWAIVQSV